MKYNKKREEIEFFSSLKYLSSQNHLVQYGYQIVYIQDILLAQI